ncbi:alpha/beta hydrolase [Nocardia sputorum]|uniref:alpha/beta hydrolase n=1 Tax=Nocardia sputorum TaxID=2984338 RepID=UPI0024936073|nr:alpha/beta hydrolase [Nocardia sputorum]
MDVPTQQTLAVPGATLYYELRGAGPLLLLIPGGNGDAGTFDAIAERLADRYTVVSYDRRGFSRSPLDEPPHDRVVTDGLDAAALLTHLTDQPAHVLGSSSGAIVALELLRTRPELVRTLVAHEPPLATLLPEGEKWLAFLDGVHERSKTEGTSAAMAEFAAGIGLRVAAPPAEQLPPEAVAMVGRIQQNLVFWMEHELRQYPRYAPDLAALRASSDRLVLGIGRESRDTFPALPNTVLAKELGLDLVEFPGDHVGYLSAPDEFVARLDDILTRDDS